MGVRVPPPEHLFGTCYLYIVHSESRALYYIGVSHDPDRRLSYHNGSSKGWTKRGRPWLLVFRQAFPSRADAQKAERFVKAQRSTTFIRKVLSGEYTLDNI